MRRWMTSLLALCFCTTPVCAGGSGKILLDTWDVAYLGDGKAGYIHTIAREIENNGKKAVHTTVELRLTVKRFSNGIPVQHLAIPLTLGLSRHSIPAIEIQGDGDSPTGLTRFDAWARFIVLLSRCSQDGGRMRLILSVLRRTPLVKPNVITKRWRRLCATDACR